MHYSMWWFSLLILPVNSSLFFFIFQAKKWYFKPVSAFSLLSTIDVWLCVILLYLVEGQSIYAWSVYMYMYVYTWGYRCTCKTISSGENNIFIAVFTLLLMCTYVCDDFHC